MNKLIRLGIFFILMGTTVFSFAQEIPDPKIYDALEWRLVGPHRGGRSDGATGVKGSDHTYYFASTGGGVWKTVDSGNTWKPVSDGFFGGSVGAVAVSESDTSVVYAGGGEKTVRGNVSFGYGVWKSKDAGETWERAGLDKSRFISRMRIHPDNPDVVYAAVMGDIFKPDETRGVFKTTDGGETWEKVLYSTDVAGAVDLVMDPQNPDVLFATTWDIKRTPYSLESGGPGSKMFKTTDGGETWEDLTEKEGFPEGTLGIMGVTVSPVNSDRVYAIIENENGGVFVSKDGGESWEKTNDDRNLRQRAWYYTRIFADSQDEETVYVLNVSYHKSTDGGKTFKSANAPHGDHHDLWIAPDDNQRMIIADDGGAQISTDGGKNWSSLMNQPTSQFYRVTTDNSFPYRIYGAQQDNSTVRIRHRTDGRSITENDWEPTAGGESGWIAPDPLNNEIVYGGSYGGYLTRENHTTGTSRSVNVYPNNPMGHGAEDMKYRFQWNFPIFFSPHNPKLLYTTSNQFHRSTNGGQSWEVFSPDLTRNDKSKLGPSGGPITKDNTSVEYYATIFTAAESPVKEGVLWAGSDDGLVHVTKDNGVTWTNVTPADMPEWLQINSIEASPFDPAEAYFAATGYKSGIYEPFLYTTKDYGETWTKITSGIDAEHFTRVIRADPVKRGILYAGTETAMYYSKDDGKNWHSLQLNLPIVPITDLAIKENNLIAATQGRSFWIIDDLTVLHQAEPGMESSELKLFKPQDSYRIDGTKRKSETAGTNRPGGVLVYYYINEEPEDELKIEFFDANDQPLKAYSTKGIDGDTLKVKKGSNEFNWNLRVEDAEDFEGMIMWSGSLRGPKVVPGTYKVKITKDGVAQEESFKVLPDPRYESSQADLEAQYEFLMSVRDKLTETHRVIKLIRQYRSEMDSLETKPANLDMIKAEMDEIEKTLYQTQNQSRQDPLNFPIRLNNKLAHLNVVVGNGDWKPTDQSYEVKDELTEKIDVELARFKELEQKQISQIFNIEEMRTKIDIKK
ncbi:VPS10 domain-containing protein [Algoriphagus machipongonensis]|uniref:Glycosyl hydrolase, BNR repeat n=1 Tax=Algoriphagus machipongonensis TaxID=388413 RepID=A3HX59_9BACT|nr:glycosyl hydrolase [Algoriphagus machipongonensis]EAZ81182.1 putative glycosyl hydrolase, BNR repeat [Algoriphagus machipongonensis]